ncbi:Eco57I restriction-modification methylase domain-containing protein [Glycomyces arizonensis]|uniref:Eco57I restriction-modification methylase domain-containing protein n=1 Tax=Glycomyces arizonensis TaxID=256035 RepID=UPI0004142205|nr:N-6 DNA methylase [Glycomyces arizonensis]
MTARGEHAAVSLEGDLISHELLRRIETGRELDGVKPADYGAVGRRSVSDEAERSWDYLKTAWTDLRGTISAADRPIDTTGAARRLWIEPLLAELGFGRPALTGGGIDSDDGQKRFRIAHQWTHVPIHMVDWGIGLEDRHAGRPAPHSVLQECLNSTDQRLWGIVTNGRVVRLLRDSTAIAGTAYVEFDLETIFDHELVNEFILLYRLFHVSRFEVAEDAPPSSCWLEKWRASAIQIGIRARDQMRDGVRDAITTLGTGFLSHPANGRLIDDLDAERFHRALLRTIYRLLFWFVAEDKGLLHPQDAAASAKERYRRYYSSARLRAHARRRRGTTHGDLYQGLKLVLDALGSEDGQPKLALPGLGGIFEATEADEVLDGLHLANQDLLRAVRALAVLRDKKTQRNRVIDHRHLEAEELGSVYESLLELVPKYSPVERRFELAELAGNQRKSSGTYYTPANLIERLLDMALDPVIDAAVKRGEARVESDPTIAVAEELLKLKVCDPACGSAHILVAAARRIAKRLAAVRERNPEPTPRALRSALREVIGRCVYGVDINPMAVELAKVALWMESLEPGKALDFLDAHIKSGNSLIGARPVLMAGGIPDAAWNPIEGDDKTAARELKKRNRKERESRERGAERLDGLFELECGTARSNVVLGRRTRQILEAPSESVRDAKRKRAAYRRLLTLGEYEKERLLADTWCAAFFWKKEPGSDLSLAPTEGTYRELERAGFDNLIGQAIAEKSAVLRDANRFFHWHLEFPEVFLTDQGETANGLTGWAGGFDAVLANPPWDKLEFEDKKYFSVAAPEIAEISGRARKQRIAEWELRSPSGSAQYRAAIRKVKGTFQFASASGSFPLCQKGLTVPGVNSLNTDQLFAELFRDLGSSGSWVGCIVPSNIATGAGAQYLFADLTGSGSLVSIFDFENAQRKFFPGADSRVKFCLLTATGRGSRAEETRFAFFLNEVDQIDDARRVYSLTPEELHLISPNTGTLPIFRDPRDARITAEIFKRVPVFWNETVADGNPWGVRFKNLFNMTDDSDLFQGRERLETEGWSLRGNVYELGGKAMLPLYEAKMVDFFDHRTADVVKSDTALKRQNQPRYLSAAEKRDPERSAQPLSWIAQEFVEDELDRAGWDSGWIAGWCDVTSATNERTAIPCLIPRTAAGHTFPVMLPRSSARETGALIAEQSSYVFDYVSRQKVSDAHMKLFIWKQLPVHPPEILAGCDSFLMPRVSELVYTAADMRPFAEDLGDQGEPFVWDAERRSVMRAELDALFFHLYEVEREDVDYIMETFPIVRKKDIAQFGSFRTKELTLEAYDQMAAAGISAANPPLDGEDFVSRLAPPPGHGPRHAPRVC